MKKKHIYRLFLGLLGIHLAFLAPGSGQSPDPLAGLLMQRVPVGARPIGIALDSVSIPGVATESDVIVANNGDNSLSLLHIGFSADRSVLEIRPVRTVQGIPQPYAVVDCGRFLVTSPSTDTVIVMSRDLQAVGSIKVGAQPFSVDCGEGGRAFVSNFGDNSLSVIDGFALNEVIRIPNVPGSRSVHGVRGFQDGLDRRNFVAVAGTQANVLTIVDPIDLRVITQIPVNRPTAIFADSARNVVDVATPLDNRIIGFNGSTLQVVFTIQGVPNAQDFLITALGQFASTGNQNSLARIGSDGSVALIPGIPGATGLADGRVVTAIGAFPPSFFFLLVTSPDSNSLFFLQRQPSVPSQFRVANAASFGSSQTAPGSLGSAFASTGVSQNFSATSLPLPKTLGGVNLRFGGSLTFDATANRWIFSPTGSIEAPLLFVGPTQVNFQVPPGISLGDSVPAQLTKPDGTTLLTTVQITAAAPGIFTVLQNGQGQAAVLNQDNLRNFGTNPAPRGSVIQIFATGAGETTPPLLPGEPAPTSGNPLVLTNMQPTVTIGGQTARVLFSGMAPGFVGLWQINAEVPQSVTLGPAVPMVISAGGVSSNTVTIAVE